MILINGKFLSQRLTGVQRFALEITKQLVALNPEIKIVVPNSPNLKIDERLKDNTIVFGRGGGIIWEQFELPKFARKSDALLLNFCNSAPVFFPNNITCVHDMSYKANPQWFSKKFKAYYSILIPQILKRARHVLTVSNFAKEEILKYLPDIKPDKITVVNNACSEVFDNPVFPESNGYLTKQFVFVGSLEPRKNLNNLLYAFSQIEDPNCRLVIVGAGNSKSFNDTGNMIPPDKRIIWKSNCSDFELKEVYSHSFALVNPSLYEGFGVPLVEAAKNAVLLAVSDIPVFREIAGPNAKFFNPNSVEDIKHKLVELLNLERPQYLVISEKSFRHFEKYSWKSSAEIINNLISNDGYA